MKPAFYILIGLVLLIGAMVPASLRLQARADLSAYDQNGQIAADAGLITFAFYDWGALKGDTLRTNAVPWKLAEAVLALRAAQGDPERAATLTNVAIFRPFGMHVPTRIANWPDTIPPPQMNGPLGIVRGQSGGFTPLSVEIGNMACATCHTSVVYDETGAPDPDAVWLGGTNASLNLNAYTEALFDGFVTYGETPDTLMDVVVARFPDITLRERLTLRYALLPELMTELAARDQSIGALLPFTPSHIGATNGYDSLRLRLGLIDLDTPVEKSYFTSIPALGSRLWRSRFLAGGVYTLPNTDHTAPVRTPARSAADREGLANIISYFLLPSMGTTAKVAEAERDAALSVVDWIEVYTPQPFPGAIDRARASQGAQVYAAQCAACHGTYADGPTLIEFPNWEGDVGTHAGPPLAATEQIANAINASLYAPYIAARPTTLRSAPPLTGLWASAPYLANGSVPTLWHLMRPDLRPDVFEIGGHRLDLDRVGLDLSPPPDHIPWSTPATFDTTRDGFSNAGHTVGFDGLSEDQKDALLEYLKQL